jgi:hypothetical protein
MLLLLACQKCELRSSDSDPVGSPEDAPVEVEHRHSSLGSQDDFVDVQQRTYFKAPDFAAVTQPNFELVDGHTACEEIPLDNRPVDNIFMESEFFDNDTITVDKMVSCNNFMESELLRIPSSSNCEPEQENWQNMSFSYNILSPFGSSPSGVLRHEEMWKFSDRAFAQGLEMTRTEKMVEHNTLDSAVPVQAILWGWHTIDAKTRNHPAWIALRGVDEKIFGLWKSKPQKIAMMYVCSLVMQVLFHCLFQANKSGSHEIVSCISNAGKPSKSAIMVSPKVSLILVLNLTVLQINSPQALTRTPSTSNCNRLPNLARPPRLSRLQPRSLHANRRIFAALYGRFKLLLAFRGHINFRI